MDIEEEPILDTRVKFTLAPAFSGLPSHGN